MGNSAARFDRMAAVIAEVEGAVLPAGRDELREEAAQEMSLPRS